MTYVVEEHYSFVDPVFLPTSPAPYTHLNGTAVTMGCSLGIPAIMPSRAAKPSEGETSPMPILSTRAAVWASPAAMPPPAHAPHCMLTAGTPASDRMDAAASRAEFAAE